jgi:hypothetical protein
MAEGSRQEAEVRAAELTSGFPCRAQTSTRRNTENMEMNKKDVNG